MVFKLWAVLDENIGRIGGGGCERGRKIKIDKLSWVSLENFLGGLNHDMPK